MREGACCERPRARRRRGHQPPGRVATRRSDSASIRKYPPRWINPEGDRNHRADLRRGFADHEFTALRFEGRSLMVRSKGTHPLHRRAALNYVNARPPKRRRRLNEPAPAFRCRSCGARLQIFSPIRSNLAAIHPSSRFVVGMVRLANAARRACSFSAKPIPGRDPYTRHRCRRTRRRIDRRANLLRACPRNGGPPRCHTHSTSVLRRRSWISIHSGGAENRFGS